MMAKEEIIYGPLELPSGMKIKFREAKGADRLNVLSVQQNVQGQNPVVLQVLSDAYIGVKCITEINGAAVQKNYKDLYEEFSEADLDYYDAMRTELFGITKEKRDAIKEKADFLRKSVTSTATSSSQGTQKQ